MKTSLGLVCVLCVLIASLAQAQVVNPRERTVFACTVTASTATTLTAVGGSCVAPGASLSLYITDIEFGASAASSTTADSAPTIKYGTGGTCGTGTTVVWSGVQAANTMVASHFMAPLKIPHNNELCWIASVAGTKWGKITGYLER
jgi:hypothetical protein